MIDNMNFCRIGGRVWNVKVIELKEDYNQLDSTNSGRSLAPGAPLIRDIFGTFYGHTVTFASNDDVLDEYDDLYMFISYPNPKGFDVEIVHNQSVIAYKAYSATGSRGLTRIKDGKVYWDTFQCNFKPMKAQVIP